MRCGTSRLSGRGETRESIAGTALHGERTDGKSFFDQRLNLWTEARLAKSEQAESFDRRAADDVRRVVIKRHEQSSGTDALSARFCDVGDDEPEVSAGAPVITCLSRPDFAEETEQTLGMGSEQLGLLLGDAACSVGGVVAQAAVV